MRLDGMGMGRGVFRMRDGILWDVARGIWLGRIGQGSAAGVGRYEIGQQWPARTTRMGFDGMGWDVTGRDWMGHL